MDVQAPPGMLRAFADLKDPRVNRTKRHSLGDILAIAICAIICGADAWTQVVKFGRCKLKWFKTFLDLPHGIPSHDTFGRVFAALDPLAFEECFMKWIADVATASAGRLIAIDGKTIRRSLDIANGKAAIHMVSAWCGANQMVLGQLATDAKSNEITAIPELLKLLDISGAVVTIDAAGCQKKIAECIVEHGGHYILQLKGNQGSLHEETTMLFDQCLTDDCHGIAYSTATTVEKGHGRSKSDGYGRQRKSTGSPKKASGRTFAASSESKPNERWAQRPLLSTATTSATWRPTMPLVCWRTSAAIGASRTACTGAWTSTSARTTAASAKDTPPRTSPACHASH